MTKPIAITLAGLNASGNVAKTHESGSVFVFISADKAFQIILPVDDDKTYVTLHTVNGRYRLKKHPTLNIYTGVCNGHHVHLSLKKVVGELRYWQ